MPICIEYVITVRMIRESFKLMFALMHILQQKAFPSWSAGALSNDTGYPTLR